MTPRDTQGPEPFGTRVRRLRTERRIAAERHRGDKDRWTQKGLALQCGVGQSAISNIEKNAWEPRSETLLALAAVFGITTEQLTAGTTMERILPTSSDIGTPSRVQSVYPLGATQGKHQPEHEGDDVGTFDRSSSGERDQVSDSSAKRRHDAFWSRLKDQKQYGRDLVRAADFIGRLGRALIAGEAQIVGVDRPGGHGRGRQAHTRHAGANRKS